MASFSRKYLLAVPLISLSLFVAVPLARSQSTATIEGTVTDRSGAPLPGAIVVVRNTATGESRTVQTDEPGNFLVSSLIPGPYTIQVSAKGMQTRLLQGITLNVNTTVTENVSLAVGAEQEVVKVQAQEPVVDTTGMTVGAVINEKSVQEAPLNGRHFVDLGTLIPGSVTAPANGLLTQPIRGQGAISFDTAGQREDTVNFMVNGINLNDMQDNQITFQPTINTVAEFRADNSTFSAEYGRSSGAIVNIATRSGTNAFHGELYSYLRNQFFDARNYFNPVYTVSGTYVPQSQFIRNQFGGDAGGPIWKDHTFFYLSYEGSRQRQGETVNAGVPPPGSAGADSTIQALLKLLPAPNSDGNFVGSASAIANIDQGTVDILHRISATDQLHGYYAIQYDSRNEPVSPTVADTIPGYGDTRPGHRQLLTLVETHTLSSNTVNEVRLGFNRIHLTYTPAFAANPTTYNIDDGITTDVGLPQITVSTLGLTFGGPSGEPSGRADTVVMLSDTFSLLKGNHSFRLGGEYRRFTNNNFEGDTGSFTFPNLTAFLNDQASSFTVTPGTNPSRILTSAVGVYLVDSWKIRRTVSAELGFRFEWNGAPTEGDNRFVFFDSVSQSLVRADTDGLGRTAYNQNYHYEPRLGLAWDVSGNGTTVVHLDYGILYNQAETLMIIPLSLNPPFAVPISVQSSGTSLSLQNAFSQAAAANLIAPNTVARNFHDPQVQSYNLTIQHAITRTLGAQIGYIGSKSTHLQMYLNENQPIGGNLASRPFTEISASSPIDPGVALGNIMESASVGNGNYNALWATLRKQIGNLQFSTTYAWSKALDYNSYSFDSVAYGTPQNSLDPHADYGPSDFDVRDRWVLSGVYNLPFKRNRLKQGWQFSTITSLQSGNPFSIHTTLINNGEANWTRPNILGRVSTSYARAGNNIQYIPQAICNTPTTGCLFSSPDSGFGDMGRNVLTGPGFEDVDIAVAKNTKINESVIFQLRTDAFNVLNHPNFGQPSSVFSPTGSAGTFGQLTSTRFPIGDFGSSRQLQVSATVSF